MKLKKKIVLSILSVALIWTLAAAVIMVLPQSGGRHSRTRCGRFVSRKNTTSLRWRMMSHASTRHGSASSKKKSEVMQTRICSPLWIL